MIEILIISLVIALIAKRESKASKEELIRAKAEHTKLARARTAVARNLRAEEIRLKAQEEYPLRQLTRCPKKRVTKRKQVILPVFQEEKVPVTVGSPSASYYEPEEEEEGTETEDLFSPEQWFGENYKALIQTSSTRAYFPESVLPAKEVWSQIGMYLIREEGFSDFIIWDDKLEIKLN